MIYLALLALWVGRGFAARRKAPEPGPFWARVVRAGGAIAVLRLGIFWTGLALLQYADWRQVVGYELLVLTSLVELGLAGSLPLSSLLNVLTSAVLGWAWVWARPLAWEQRAHRK